MREYYYNDMDGPQERSRSVVMIVADGLIFVISLVMVVLMALVLLVPHYHPSSSWIYPSIGLISPAIYLVAVLLALYWIIRWRWVYALLLLVPLLIGMPRVSLYLKLETAKIYEPSSKRGIFKVLSYNVRGVIGDDHQASTDSIVSFIERERPDIICFQEFETKRLGDDDSPLLAGYNRSQVKGQAIYTRYKILSHSENLVSDEFSSGSGYWADILIGSDTVRLYNLHLHSTEITKSDNEYISSMEFVGDSLSDDKFKSMLLRFRDTSLNRAQQADSIAHSISLSPHSVIVCGDFNDTPNSYVYHKIASSLDGEIELQDAFQEAGDGYSYTYRGFLNMLRIDYILVSQPIEVLSYEVPREQISSDHLPVITTLKFR